MGSGVEWKGDIDQRFVRYLQKLEARVVALEHRAFRIPILDADPVTGDPTNMWMLSDGKVRIRNDDGSIVVVNPTISTGGSGTSTTTKPPNVQTQTYRKSYAAIWGSTYDGDSSRRTDTRHLYYGRVSSTHGRQKSAFGFNSGTIMSDLSGARISKVELYVLNQWTYPNAGSYLYFYTHGAASMPGSFPAASGPFGHYKFGKPDGHWITIPVSVGNSLKSGFAKGFSIIQPSDSTSYYGYATGVADGGTAPTLRITYVK